MKVLIVTKRFIAGGGATLVTALIVDALLKLDCEVKVVCYDLDPLDKFKQILEIDLNHPKLSVDQISTRLSRRLRWSGYLDSLYLMHFVKKKGYRDYVMFSTWDEMDLGRKCLQYVHWVSHHPKTNNGTGPVSKSLISLAMMGYRTFVSEVLDFEITRVKKNVSIFNSHLTEREFEKLYGANSGHVVYPPVVIERTASKPFSEREDGFIYSGRVVRDKNIHRMIEFLEKVRAGGIEVHFHVVGPTPDGEYKRELQEKYPHGWITFEGNKSRAELSEILGRHKYAIQARYLEPFGMAAAEAAKLGCLTFVPKRSGFAELLEDDSLKFDDFAELNHKFSQLWSDKELQETISDKLRRQFVEFTPEVFQSQIQSIFLESVKQLDV